MSSRKIYRQWYCAQTHPAREAQALKQIESQLGLKAYFPSFIHQGKKKEFTRGLFPGYLFIQFSISRDGWERLYSVEGIRRVFGSTPFHPSPISALVMRQIMREEAKLPQPDGKQPMLNEKLALPAPGQQVTILTGPMKNFVGICTKSSNERIAILLSIFGRETELQYQPSDVSAA
jgi:transcription antitermination factor NusG